MSLAIEADRELCQKRMTLSGKRHVEHSGQTNPYGTLGFPRAKRGDSGPWIRLHFFAAKRTTHPQTLDRDQVPGDSENPRHNLLGFRWMLCGGIDHDAA